MFTDSLTLSAAASGTWAIPPGTTEIYVSGIITGLITSQSIDMNLKKQSDGTSATFDQTVYTGATAVTEVNLAGTGTINGWNGGGNAGTTFAIEGRFSNPRNASVKTVAKGTVSIVSNNTSNHEFRNCLAIATTAEDHDELVILADAGALTGTLHIEYML